MRDTREQELQKAKEFGLRNTTYGAFGEVRPRFQKLDLAKLNRWEMSQRPEPECTGRCFGCHNSLCINSIFPYEELERIAVEMEDLNETHNSHRDI